MTSQELVREWKVVLEYRHKAANGRRIECKTLFHKPVEQAWQGKFRNIDQEIIVLCVSEPTAKHGR